MKANEINPTISITALPIFLIGFFVRFEFEAFFRLVSRRGLIDRFIIILLGRRVTALINQKTKQLCCNCRSKCKNHQKRGLLNIYYFVRITR